MLIVMLPGVVLFEKVILPINVMLVPGVVVFGVMTVVLVYRVLARFFHKQQSQTST